MGDVAQGTKISWRGTDVAEIVSFTGPAITHEPVDLTDLDDSAMQFKPAGVYDPGEISVELNYDEDLAIHGTLVTDIISGTTGALVITFDNAGAGTGTMSATAFVIGFTPGGSVGDKLTASASWKLSGTLTPA